MRASVAIVINSLRKGGAEKQAVRLANGLARTVDVTFIVLDERRNHPSYQGALDCSQVAYFGLPGASLVGVCRLRAILRARAVTTVFAYLTMSTGFSLFAAWGMKSVTVFGSIRNSRLSALKTFLEVTFARVFRHTVIFNSYAGADYFRGKGISRVLVIPNCYPAVQPYRLRSPREVVTIISVGRFVPAKDYPTALEALRLVRVRTRVPFRYWIVGWGPLEEELRTLVRCPELDGLVRVFVDPPNIPELLGEAEVFLSTSIFEGTSNAIMEAMDAALPVVATSVGDNDRLVVDGETGFLCPPREPACLADRLVALLENPDLRDRQGQRANRRLRDDYSEEAFLQAHFRLL